MVDYIDDNMIYKVCEESGFSKSNERDNLHIFRCNDKNTPYIYIELDNKVAFLFPRINNKIAIYVGKLNEFPSYDTNMDLDSTIESFKEMKNKNSTFIYNCDELPNILYNADLWNAKRYKLLSESPEIWNITDIHHLDQKAYISDEISID